MSTKLTFIAPAGLNAHRQKLVRVRCECGVEFECREDAYKSGRTKSCGCTRTGGRKRAAQSSAPQPEQPKSEQNIVPEIESKFKRGTPQWFDDEIARIDAAATASENRARFLELEIATQESTDLPTHKCWATENTTANKMRQAISRLQIAKANAETATTKTAKSQAEINREKIASLRGGQ